MPTCDIYSKDRVATFYGQNNGWRMFDGRILTREIDAYLIEEKQHIARYLAAFSPSLHQFIEIGCGYARYLPVALKYNVGYLGVELVDWLAELGKARIAAIQLPKNYHAQVEHLSAEHLHCILPNKEQDNFIKSCAFFPFNCFGNLSDPKRVLAQLKGRNVEVIISSFATHTQATLARMAYYKVCGCRGLSSQHIETGVCIRSDESLESLAYQPAMLEKLLSEFDYQLTKQISHSTIGELFFFAPIKTRQQINTSQSDINADDFILQAFVDEEKQHGLMGHIHSTAWGLGKNARVLSVNVNDVGWTDGGLVWLLGCPSSCNDTRPLIASGTILKVHHAQGNVRLLINTH